jgi:hypothetical protein
MNYNHHDKTKKDEKKEEEFEAKEVWRYSTQNYTDSEIMSTLNISRSEERPIIIQWLNDLKRDTIDDGGNVESQIRSGRSARSDRNNDSTSSSSTTTTAVDHKAFKCFYCDEYFYSNDERRNHRGQYHPDKPLDYPNRGF